MLLASHRADRFVAAGIGRSADARAGAGRGADSRALLRRLPHRSARDRGRSAATENADHPRPSDRRHGRQARPAACAASANADRRCELGQRVGVAWLRHTCGRCGFCTSGQGESLRVGPVHRLSRRRRIRRIRRRAGGVLLRTARRRSATSRPRRCCVRASSAIGRCGAAICRPAADWPSTASARRPTW